MPRPLLLLAVVSILSCGCDGTRSVPIDDLRSGHSGTVDISLKDGRMITAETCIAFGDTLRCVGSELLLHGSRPFSGAVALDQIVTADEHVMNPGWYVLLGFPALYLLLRFAVSRSD